MTAYYNEIDPFAAQWLRNLISDGRIAPGDVDERSIADVQSDDLIGYTQCHFFAGIGGWALAARLSRWPDDRPLWTGSCPCQPFSVAGKGEGQKDERHLWPEYFRLISDRRPDVVMGEQVEAAIGKDWLDGVYSDMEEIDYSLGAVIVPACAVGAPHDRPRIWFVANPYSTSGQWQSDASVGREIHGATVGRHGSDGRGFSAWEPATTLDIGDRKSRRAPADLRFVAHGVPSRVGQLRSYGNAIVPQVAAEVIGAYMEIET